MGSEVEMESMALRREFERHSREEMSIEDLFLGNKDGSIHDPLWFLTLAIAAMNEITRGNEITTVIVKNVRCWILQR